MSLSISLERCVSITFGLVMRIMTAWRHWIKWNPAIKRASDRDALRKAVRDGKLIIIATDHVHPIHCQRKSGERLTAASGGPPWYSILSWWCWSLPSRDTSIIERVVECMCHNPAKLFEVEQRLLSGRATTLTFVLVDLTDLDGDKRYYC